MYRAISLAITALCIFSASAQSLYMEKADSADIYINTDRWNDAERVLKEALRLEPANFNNALLLSNLGRVQTHQRRYDEAMESYNLGLLISPSNTTLLYNRALLHTENGNDKEAINDLSKALSVDTLIVNTRLLRGLLYLKNSNLKDAEKDFRAVLDINPDNLDALDGLGNILGATGDYKQGIEIFTKIINIEPSEETYFKRALYYAMSGNIDNASEDIRNGLKINSLYGNLYLLRAYIHQLNYQTSEKEADIKTGLQFNGNPELFKNLLR